MNRRAIYLLFFILLISAGVRGQEKISLTGYISDMQTVYHVPNQWLWENNFQDRFKLMAYPKDWLSGSLQLRSRIITGNTVNKLPGYAENMAGDPGFMDLTWMYDGNLGDNAGLI